MQDPTVSEIRDLLATNNKAVARAIVALYRRQMADEQALGTTVHRNGLGFNAADASIGSKHAQRILYGAGLSDADIAFWRQQEGGGNSRIGKYAGQLQSIARERVAAKMLKELADE